MAKIFAFLLTLLIASHAHAQVVSQGRGGTSPWLITFDGGQPVTGPQTDAQARAPKTITDVLDGPGDIVELELEGSTSVSVNFPDFNTFSGSVVFESMNGGDWKPMAANNSIDWGVANPAISSGAVAPSNYTWYLILAGGETHVRVRVTAFTSGSVTVTMTGTLAVSSPMQVATFAGGGGTRPFGTVLVGGRDGNDARPVQIRGDADGAGNQGFVVWDMAATHRVGGSMLGARDFGTGIGGRDASDQFVFGELRDTDPASDVNGLVVRNIPSGTQAVSGTVTANQSGAPWSVSGSGTFTVGATNLDIRDLLFASDAVDVTGSSVSITGSVEVTATDFDIRDLSFATDTVDVSGSVVSLTDTSTSGVIDALDETVDLSTNGYSGLAIQFTGTWDGALRVETSVNGTDWNNLNVFNSSNPTTFTSEFTSNGVQFRAIAALPFVRVRANSWNSGSATVTMAATMAAGQGQSIAGPISFAPGSSLTVDQGIGTANIGDSWYTKISDGTDGPAEVVALNESLGPTTFGVLTRANIADLGGTSVDVTASNALKVDGSAVTQPVSGSGNFTVVQPTGTNLHVVCDSGCGGAATFADDDAFTFGTTSINISGFVFDDASPNAVTENSAAAPRMSGNRVPYAQLRDAAGNERGANVTASNSLATDTTTIAGNAVSTGVGASGTGTQRVAALIHDGTDTLLVTTGGAATADLTTIAGTATAVNNGSVSAGVQRVTIADDSTGEIRVADNAGNQIPSSTSEPAEADRGIFVRVVHPDPCKTGLTTHLPISLTANTQLIAASGSTHVYICSINLVVAAATNVAVVSGTGSVCATSIAGVFGGSTAATGWNFTGNGGLTFGNGDRMVGRTVDAGDALCILVSAANQTSGSITYVQQ